MQDFRASHKPGGGRILSSISQVFSLARLTNWWMGLKVLQN